MQNIYDDMNKLITNLNKEEAVVQFKEINKEIHKEENKELYGKIQEFQSINLEINNYSMMGENVPENVENRSKELYNELIKNEIALKYFEKEMELTNLITNLNTSLLKEISKIYEV